MLTGLKLYYKNSQTAQAGTAHFNNSSENQLGLHRFSKMWVSMLKTDNR